jgi:biopolymer transport protein ExbD
MSKRHHHYKRKNKEEDIDVTPLLNVMVVLIAFLIFSAVFTRISIQEIALPTPGASVVAQDVPPIVIEIIVRKNVLEVSDGNSIIVSLPKQGGLYDTQKLSEYLWQLKQVYTEKQDVNILLEPDIEYEVMIQVVDAVKIAVIKQDGKEDSQQVILFPQVSLGDAP